MDFFRRKPKKVNEAAPLDQDAKRTSFLNDKSQLGLRVFFDSRNAAFDVLFIHGLGGHWRDTWRAQGAQIPWPQELLPLRLPYGRILSYGYDSHVSDWRRMVSQNTVTDHADNLLRDLSNHRDEDNSNHRPIFFVAHSLGGLICEDALVRSRSSPNKHNQQILACTKGIVFMGTPHGGTEALATWAKVLATSLGLLKQTNPHILEVLRRNSELLYRIQTEFHTMIRDRKKRNETDIEIVCFFEELPILGIGFVVPKESAALSAYQSTGLAYNHSEMTRLKDAEDPAFKAVSAELLRWSRPLQPITPKHPPGGFLEASLPQDTRSLGRSNTIPHFPLSRNSSFVGCDEILKSIEIQLQKKSRVALNGIGGVGKTEIATEFCYRSWSEQPHVSIFWVPCDSLTKIELAFRQIALILSLGGHDDPDTDKIQLVSRYFRQSDAKPWLLVLDNADDVELLVEGDNALARFVPKYRNGSVIITTRDRYVAQAFTGSSHGSLTINRLSPMDALTLFRSKLPDNMKPDEMIEEKVLEILEFLPLCITQAAAYIDLSDISLLEYYMELTESEASLLEILDEDHIDLRRGFDSPNSVLRAWKLSFEKIRCRSKQAGQLLSVMAFLDRQCISRDLLQGLVESRHQLNQALGTLQRFCLIATESSRDSFKMHRLVQLATRFWLSGKKTDYEALALKVVTANFCAPDGEDDSKRMLLVPHAKVVETYTFHDKGNNLSLAKLQYSIASYDLRAGHYDTAAKSCHGAYQKQVALCGDMDLDTLHFRGLLGVIKTYQGLYAEAYILHTDILSKKETVLGAKSLDTIDTVSDLSEVLEQQGEFASAQGLAERALAIRKRCLGDDHPKTLQILMLLALLLRRQARYLEAETLSRKVLEGYERTLPRGHEATLKSAYALAGVLRESGNFDEAVAISKTVVEGRQSLLGHDHPQTLLAINNLALGYRLRGELELAERTYRHVCASHERLQRQTHPEALQAYQNLAVVLRERGNYDEAENIGRQTLAGREQVLGPEHPSTMNTASDLAMTLAHKEAYTEAAVLASRALAGRTRRLGPIHTYTLDTLFTVASIRRHTGQMEEAKAAFRAVLEGRIKVLGLDHPATKAAADALASLGETRSPDA